jgi:hypothetical protein
MPKFRITIQRVEKETYTMELEGDDAMKAFDEARAMVKARNEASTSGIYSVIKIEDVKEST